MINVIGVAKANWDKQEQLKSPSPASPVLVMPLTVKSRFCDVRRLPKLHELLWGQISFLGLSPPVLSFLSSLLSSH